MTDKRWKRLERETARLLGSNRNPNNGHAQADIDAGRFAVEHKARRSLPQWLTDALEQAGTAADGRVPVVVLCAATQGRKARRIVCVEFNDWISVTGREQ